MSRTAIACLMLFASAAVATAEPLPWSYYVEIDAPKGYDGILFGTEVRLPETDGGSGMTYYHYWDLSGGIPLMWRGNYQTPLGTETLFTLTSWPAHEKSVTSLPVDKKLSPGVFQLSWGYLGSRLPEMEGGSTTGTISADGLFTSGTGNYTIGLDYEERVSMSGRAARIRFEGVNRESASEITMTVTEIAPGVPEPCTVVLGGIALAGGVGAWRRHRAKLASGK